MSSRQLRKLQQQKELEEAARRAEDEAQAEEESEEEPSRTPPKPRASLFANFAGLEDEADGENEDSDQEALSEPGLAPTPTPKPKKAKKKKKKKTKQVDETLEKKKESIDAIDAALRDLRIKKSTADSWHNRKPELNPQFEKICELVRIQTQHLKVANEMRNLFGKAALENHDDAGGPVGRGGRPPRGQRQQADLETALKGHHLPGKGLAEITLRRNILIQGKSDWPKGTTGGLTMEMVEDYRQTDGTVEFRFVHDKTYQTMQQTFHGLVEIGDPQNLIGFLTKNPYHISSLLQVSKIAKDQTDHALSSDLLERALFTFGRASLSLFNTKLAQGKARLDFTRPENRELWLAGYQYIKSLIMKGTYRTAFEWAKLLLSLDPEDDPYCMRLMLHHLAVRAHESKWLLEMGDFALQQEALPEDDRIVKAAPYTIYHNTPTLALAALQLKDGVKSRDLLTRSMKRCPWLFVALFTELNLESPKSIWGNQPRTDAENLFTSLYVQQTKDLWNTTEGTAILMEISHTIQKVDTDGLPIISNDTMDLDVVRFIYLDNTPALMAMVPSRLLHRSNNSESDPVPPNQSIYSYKIEGLGDDAGPRGLGDGFDHPMAALRRLLFHQRAANRGNSDDDGELEDIIRNGVGGMGSEGEDEGQSAPSPGFASRLLNYIFRSGVNVAADDDTEDEDEGPDLMDTEDELPDLVPFEHRFRDEGHEDNDDEMAGLEPIEEGDTDEEMPPLV